MTIYAPTPILTASEKRLLHLILHLLLESAWKASPQSNLLGDEIALSPSESKELLRLLRELFDSKEFQESLFFVEAIASRRAGDAAKRIFLNRRKEIGKSRALSSIRWAEFLHRMGIGPAIPWGP